MNLWKLCEAYETLAMMKHIKRSFVLWVTGALRYALSVVNS